MRYLLYGIVRRDLTPCPAEPGPATESTTERVRGICLLAAHGLAAAASPVEEIGPDPGVSALLAFEKVVEAIHAREDVIPLRYGCVMESESAVIRLLEDHREEYEELLSRLMGMTEMGIRILWPPGASAKIPASPGAAYLASLRNRYHSAGGLTPEEAQLTDRIMGWLSGYSTEQRREVSWSDQGRLISLYFLTLKSAAEELRQRARQLFRVSGAKLLLSGPWPPYNFVAPAG